MAEPLSNGTAYESVPESYIFPLHRRPGSLPSSSATLPLVDLNGDYDDDVNVAKQIVDAGREFGFFQVVNHGVPDEMMSHMMAAVEEFFNLPAEEKWSPAPKKTTQKHRNQHGSC